MNGTDKTRKVEAVYGVPISAFADLPYREALAKRKALANVRLKKVSYAIEIIENEIMETSEPTEEQKMRLARMIWLQRELRKAYFQNEILLNEIKEYEEGNEEAKT